MYLKIHESLASKFPGLSAMIIIIRGVAVKAEDQVLESFKVKVMKETANKWKLDDLKEDPVFRAYRDFFWRVKVDPTKTRPAAEALIRRVLRGNQIPIINTLVDSYNLASMATTIPFGAFDLRKMRGELVMREARIGEEFLGIGMETPLKLQGGEAVIQDDERLIAVYPYRDADYSKVTYETKEVLLMTCGVPGITESSLTHAETVGVEYITRFCGGVTS